MRALLDVNVLIALLDGNHVFHEKAHTWWIKNEAKGWASCPLSENGVIRVMTIPAYRKQKKLVPSEVVESLQNFASTTNHEFWADDLSLRDNKIFDSEKILSGQHLTDIYLLALAAKNHSQLVTFDQNIPVLPIRIAKPENLLVL
jgi:toxin-antitoxin system PIN domain toxin